MPFLRSLWESWKKVGRVIGDFIARVILTLFYFTIFLPFGLVVRLFSDRLDSKEWRAPAWDERKTTDLTIEDTRRQS
ncbi:MAG: hypothetical protein M9928_10340 [Anaerolineae bacterium]|nr:hypothetical protein [Anaerolineae bacterium]MCO5205421.1 hypothetical protein [Anaerolineae bacterium]